MRVGLPLRFYRGLGAAGVVRLAERHGWHGVASGTDTGHVRLARHFPAPAALNAPSPQDPPAAPGTPWGPQPVRFAPLLPFVLLLQVLYVPVYGLLTCWVSRPEPDHWDRWGARWTVGPRAFRAEFTNSPAAWDRHIRRILERDATRILAAARLREAERRQREAAVTLQRSLLPQKLDQPAGLRVAATYQPGGAEAAVGGDWYDVIAIDGGRTALVIGDVMGRGLRAAAVMGQLRTAVRAYARLDLPPHEVMRLLDGLAMEIDANQIATCTYAVWDPRRRTLSYASAGHLPVLLRCPDGTILRSEEQNGPPLGTGGGLHVSHTLRLLPGTTGVLYTDGLVERRDEDIDQGLDLLARTLAGAMGAPEVICARLLRAMGVTSEHDDDVAVLAFQLPAEEEAEKPVAPVDSARPEV
ncbi:PP2C family protein-serine/threonine phosphatase [Kitasatospora sp. NPDC091257]|uniref:PP2C family protein-serine/threonine phosphatase n=1 Tax=Kitasatospora sp. NPDC091257 TaxID=3364084 RepID=UPI0037F9D19F